MRVGCILVYCDFTAGFSDGPFGFFVSLVCVWCGYRFTGSGLILDFAVAGSGLPFGFGLVADSAGVGFCSGFGVWFAVWVSWVD